MEAVVEHGERDGRTASGRDDLDVIDLDAWRSRPTHAVADKLETHFQRAHALRRQQVVVENGDVAVDAAGEFAQPRGPCGAIGGKLKCPAQPSRDIRRSDPKFDIPGRAHRIDRVGRGGHCLCRGGRAFVHIEAADIAGAVVRRRRLFHIARAASRVGDRPRIDGSAAVPPRHRSGCSRGHCFRENGGGALAAIRVGELRAGDGRAAGGLEIRGDIYAVHISRRVRTREDSRDGRRRDDASAAEIDVKGCADRGVAAGDVNRCGLRAGGCGRELHYNRRVATRSDA